MSGGGCPTLDTSNVRRLLGYRQVPVALLMTTDRRRCRSVVSAADQTPHSLPINARYYGQHSTYCSLADSRGGARGSGVMKYLEQTARGALQNDSWIFIGFKTRGQSNLIKSASRGAHSPVRGHPRGSKFVPLNS